PRQLVQKGASAPGKHKASMLQDVLAKRQTEVDFMNGAIVQWGEKVGVPTPLNKALWELIKGLERSWSDPEERSHPELMSLPLNIGVLQLSMEASRATLTI